MPDWLLALLIVFGFMAAGGLLGLALFRAHLASERRRRP